MNERIAPGLGLKLVFDVRDKPELALEIADRLEELGFEEDHDSVDSDKARNISIGLYDDAEFCMGYSSAEATLFFHHTELSFDQLFDMEEELVVTLKMPPYERTISVERAQKMREKMENFQAEIDFSGDEFGQDTIICENLDEVWDVYQQLCRKIPE